MSKRRFAVLSSLVLSFAAQGIGVPVRGPRHARADESDPGAPRKVEWRAEWPRFRLWEYAGTAAFGAATLAIDHVATLPAEPRWTGGILFDDSVRGWLRADSADGRRRAGTVSDRLWLGGSAVPFVVDLPVALLAHRQPEVAWQLLMMDLEAYSVAGFFNRLLHFEAGRGRPSLDACRNDGSYDALCGAPSNNASFPSGHTLGVATAAGLTCVHHRYLPLYGSEAADTSACVLMSLATVATATTRIMADRHYASDVLAGAALGFTAGYGLPWLLHYRARRPADGGGTPAPERFTMLVPYAGSAEVGLGVVGIL